MKQSLASKLDENLPRIISEIAEKNSVVEYQGNPDFSEERLRSWHQFGLMTHTRKVREAFAGEMVDLLKEWGVGYEVDGFLSQRIDNLTKRELLDASIVLHDLGKVVCVGDDGFNRNHEAISLSLIKKGLIYKILRANEISEDQIQYIEKCVETHDVVGKEIRDVLKHSRRLNLSYLDSWECRNLCEKVAEEYDKSKVEMGIYFICDTLGKTDVRISAGTHIEKIDRIIEKRGLNPSLRKAITQQPITIKLGEVYMTSISDYPSSN